MLRHTYSDSEFKKKACLFTYLGCIHCMQTT